MRTNEAQWHIIVGIVVIMFNLLTQVSATVYAYADFNETEVFDDMEASFGPNVDSNGITGLLVPAEPIDACKQIKISPFGPCNPQNITIASFALIERGGCDFGLKVWNAQAAGFCGAIVYNVNSDSLVRMSTSVSSDIYIPSVFIGETSAVHLNSTYLYNDKGNPYIQIYEYSFNPLDYYLVPFIVVIGVCFVSLLCFLLVKCLRDRRRARRGRLSLQRLKKLPVKKFDKGDEYDVCAICLEDYEEGDSLRILPCDHAYHCKCVDPWLTSNKRICPLCKRRVLSDDESSTSSEDVDDSSDDEQTPLVRPSATSPHSLGRNHGYGSSGSYSGQLSRQRLRSSSTSSIETTSTDIPEPRLLTPKNTPSKVSSSTTDHSKVNQSFTFTEVTEQRPNNVASAMNTNVWMDPDDYLNTAEAVLTGPRVSESSITVLPDLATHDEIHGHSYSSEDFHSLDESVATVENSPNNIEARSSSAEHDTDQDDIIVITQGSRTTIGEDDGEV